MNDRIEQLEFEKRNIKEELEHEIKWKEAKIKELIEKYYFFKEILESYLTSYKEIKILPYVDSNKDYSKDNCVSCCKLCNFMKYTYSLKQFIKMITFLLSINGKIDRKTNYNHVKYFVCSQNAKYSKFIYEAKLRKLSCEISKQTYNEIIQQNCNYCKNPFENNW